MTLGSKRLNLAWAKFFSSLFQCRLKLLVSLLVFARFSPELMFPHVESLNAENSDDPAQSASNFTSCPFPNVLAGTV